MRLRFPHLLLIAGILTVILSFLYFGRATETYDIIILTGLLVSAVSFLVIIFGKGPAKRSWAGPWSSWLP